MTTRPMMTLSQDPSMSTTPVNSNESNTWLAQTSTTKSKQPDLEHDYDSDSSEEGHRRDEEVRSLARELTRQATFNPEGTNPFSSRKDGPLDPSSDNFDPRAWVKSLMHLQTRDPERYPLRTAGFSFKNLSAYGYGASTDYQKSVGNVWLESIGLASKLFGQNRGSEINILQDFDGLMEAGEMLIVLGPPGSGCSTFLKTISGETLGFTVEKNSQVNYQGISFDQMHKDFRGEAIYTAEIDVHFPMLTVGDTLAFAARARAPREIPGDVDPWTYANHLRDVLMAVFGISHTIDTRVGDDYVRGVSGGERKRVSIAEATLSGAPLQSWDNSTRGLDSANAIQFCKNLRLSTDLMGTTACVSMYQAPQSAYDIFDKVIVLYEGHQIFFGSTKDAKAYFINLGFECPDRQTTADFLTSMTSSAERVVRPGFESRVPRSAEEFARLWKDSHDRQVLLHNIDSFDRKFAVNGENMDQFLRSRKAEKSKYLRTKSPYTLSYFQQVKLCLWRGFLRVKGDPSFTLIQLASNFMIALVVGSVFYNLQPTTSSFSQRGALIFFAGLINAFGSLLEIMTLYAQRPIVEKHSRYALYHASAEALASILTDLPYKIVNTITFNLTLYFMTNLRREPGAFFFFLLISFFLTLTMSMLFRSTAALSRTLSQAMAPSAIIILAIVIYAGLAIPTQYMLGWSRWINYINPVGWAFESLMLNEFHGCDFACIEFIPSGGEYANTGNFSKACSMIGSVAGSSVVNGDSYINTLFVYQNSHKWRNLGIMTGLMCGFAAIYLFATEYISEQKFKGEILLFRRGHNTRAKAGDEESVVDKLTSTSENHQRKSNGTNVQAQTAVFSWSNVCYDVNIKNEKRRILDQVDGWVKPGTLTALMGVSGAGKTTLLDVLSSRVTTGVVTGDMLVDGHQTDESFQRKTGYVQQQDLHLPTSTVREALGFSALLRQPAKIPRSEKLDYVNTVIGLLDMEDFADAVVGVPGEGLNVEQRKRLTIGIELAAKPQLLLFLDEPTSGLDSQTAWSICDLMEKLTKQGGQAILCTIHQPSAMLFQRFDRLLFLYKGGRTVYFGDIGFGSKTITSYFERNGAPKCPPDANPAEWILEVIGAAPGTRTYIDWPQVWNNSPEKQNVKSELQLLKEHRSEKKIDIAVDHSSFNEFAAPFMSQMHEVLIRVFQQYWRTPSYIYSKTALSVLSSLFIGFSFFHAKNTQQGLQNQMFAIFSLILLFGNLVEQIMPHFVIQRTLYEARERPSKTYSWEAFVISNIIVELPWNTLMAILSFFCWYYPIGLYRNAAPTDTVSERGLLMFLLIWTFFMLASTFASMVIVGVDTAETGGSIAQALFILCIVFCGIFAPVSTLPRFWIFMYRVSPFTYLVGGMLTTGLANTVVECAQNEFVRFQPPSGQTCALYLQSFMNDRGGYLSNPDAVDECSYCAVNNTNAFLDRFGASYGTRWRDFGIMWAFIIFNIAAAVGLYWLLRVPKNRGKKGNKSR